MIRESYDEIYNGPRQFEPMETGTLGEVGSDTDSAFALGREIFNKDKEWFAALKKGYAWQKNRK